MSTAPTAFNRLPTTTRLEQAQRKQEVAAARPSLAEGIPAVTEDWVGPWFARMADGWTYDFDPTYHVNEAEIERLSPGIPPEMVGEFGRAISRDHADKIREQLLEVSQARSTLSQMGWTGTALRMVGSVLDPAFVAASVGTGMLAPLYKGGRIARLAQAGLVNATPEMLLESVRASQDPESNAKDVIFAGLVAFGVGGGIDTLVSGKIAKSAREVNRSIVQQDIFAMGAASPGTIRPESTLQDMLRENIITSKGAKYLTENDVAKASRERWIRAMGVEDDDEIEQLKALSESDFLSTIQSKIDFEPGVRNMDALSYDPSQTGADRSQSLGIGKFKSFITSLGQSESPTVRRLANMAWTDHVPKKGGTPQDMGADLWTEITRARLSTPLVRTFKEEFPKWYGRHAHEFTGHARRMNAESAFRELVANARRGVDVAPAPEVARMAKAVDDAHRAALDIGKQHGVKGTANFEHGTSYLHRAPDTFKIGVLEEKYGEKFVRNLVTGAVKSAQPEIDADVAEKVAGVWLQHAKNRTRHSDLEMWGRMSGLDEKGLADMLKNEVPGISDDQVKAIAYGLAPPRPDANAPNVTKRRVVIDEAHSVYDADGNTIRFSDLLDNDALQLTNRYIQEMVGGAATTQMFRQFASTKLDEPIETVQQMLRVAEDELRAMGTNETDIIRQMQELDTTFRHLRGIPVEQTTENTKAMKRVRQVASLIIGGALGAAQLSDVGTAVGEAGFKATWKQIPAMGQIVKQMVTGNRSEMMEAIEVTFGMLGTQEARSHYSRSLEDMFNGSKFWNNVDYDLYRVGRFSNWINGLAPTTMFLQKSAAALAMQKIANLSLGGRPISAKRWKTLGIKPEMGARIQAAFKAEAAKAENAGVSFTRGQLTGTRLRTFDFTKFDDQEAARAVFNSVGRFAARVSNIADMGAMAEFTNKEMWRLLLQYRSFMFKTWRNSVTRGVHMHDFDTFQGWAASSIFAGLGYAALQASYLPGQPDPEKFIEDRLSLDKIALASAQRSTWSSILPSVADTVMKLAQQDPIFQYGSTGLSRGIDANTVPVVSLGNQAFRAAAGAIGAATQGEEEYSRQDAVAATKLVPFRNVVGIKNLLDYVTGQLPEE